MKGLCVLKVITKRSNVFEGSAWILFADQEAEQDFSLIPLGWPWEAQSSPRVARESWGLRSSH